MSKIREKYKINETIIKIGSIVIILCLFICLVCGCGSSNKKETTSSQNESLKTSDNSPQSQVDKGTQSSDKQDKRPQRDGFDSSNNKTYEMGIYTIDIPFYWSSSQEISNGFQLFAETGGKVAMLQATFSPETDIEYEVSFDSLMRDNDNMINALESSLFKEVENYDVIDTGIVKGILYEGTIDIQNLSGKSQVFVFPSASDRTWYYVTSGYTDNTEYMYDDDFLKIIGSLNTKETEVAENTDDPTVILTIDNCEDLKEILTAEYVDTTKQAEFVSKYKGRTIEFNCLVLELTQDPKLSTIFTYVLVPGEDEKHVGAALFVLENASRFDFNWDKETRPEYVTKGTKLRMQAKVITGEEQMYIYLDPVCTWGR